jgi:glycosyltransferase involved in cell wall biosynthesis
VPEPHAQVPASAGSPPVDVSVVLPCRNAERHLAAQLEALCEQEWTGTWEVVVSDNGSTDGSLAIVERFRARLPLRVVDSSAAPGPGGARNAGVRAARGQRILFCDADDRVAPGWLAAMAGALEEAGLVGAQVDHELLNDPSPVRARPSRPGLLQSQPPYLPYTFGGALGVRRAVHDGVGGFDESYRDSCEDRDYCYRVQLAGTPLVFVEGAVVHYRYRQRALDIYRQSRGYARGHVQLYRDYWSRGLRRPSVLKALVHWVLMPFRLLPALTSRDRFSVWMFRLGWRVGRLEASIRFRIWAL